MFPPRTDPLFRERIELIMLATARDWHRRQTRRQQRRPRVS
jgi:hypothetical protein